jgi:hypothetical protein
MNHVQYSLSHGLVRDPPPTLVVYADRARYESRGGLWGGYLADTAGGEVYFHGQNEDAPALGEAGASSSPRGLLNQAQDMLNFREGMGVNHWGEGFNLLWADGRVTFRRNNRRLGDPAAIHEPSGFRFNAGHFPGSGMVIRGDNAFNMQIEDSHDPHDNLFTARANGPTGAEYAKQGEFKGPDSTETALY